MTIAVGDKLPDATFTYLGPDGPATRTVEDLTRGRKVAIFAVPGAFTPTCSRAHMPSFVNAAEELRAKGVDEIACISVNDVHVMREWGRETGAHDAGIAMLSDGDGAFTRAMGMDFSAGVVGMFGRSKRYSAYVEDGVVKVFNLDDTPGQISCSLGEALVDQI